MAQRAQVTVDDCTVDWTLQTDVSIRAREGPVVVIKFLAPKFGENTCLDRAKLNGLVSDFQSVFPPLHFLS